MRKHIFITAILIITGFTSFSQKEVFLDIDSVKMNKTLEIVYQQWFETKQAEKFKLDTIYCEYYITFDSLNLSIDLFEDSILKKHARLKTFVWEENKKPSSKNTSINIYDCNCDVIAKDSAFLGSMVSQNNFHFYENINNKIVQKSWRFNKLYNKKNLIIALPSSSVHTFNFNWHLVIIDKANIKWFNIYTPLIDFNSKELYHLKWNDFLLK